MASSKFRLIFFSSLYTSSLLAQVLRSTASTEFKHWSKYEHQSPKRSCSSCLISTMRQCGRWRLCGRYLSQFEIHIKHVFHNGFKCFAESFVCTLYLWSQLKSQNGLQSRFACVLFMNFNSHAAIKFEVELIASRCVAHAFFIISILNKMELVDRVLAFQNYQNLCDVIAEKPMRARGNSEPIKKSENKLSIAFR